MEYKNIEIASKLKSEVETLKLEIDQIEGFVKVELPNKSWLFAKRFKTKPTEKTYKGYYCSKDLDCLGSSILINQREAKAVIEVKKEEIKELEQKIANLD